MPLSQKAKVLQQEHDEYQRNKCDANAGFGPLAHLRATSALELKKGTIVGDARSQSADRAKWSSRLRRKRIAVARIKPLTAAAAKPVMMRIRKAFDWHTQVRGRLAA
jgi:hypothetical protein